MASTEQVDTLASGDKDAVCYLCLDAEADENSQPLQRDCSCRGTDAGFVHLICLTNFAASKSKQARDTNEFVNPWKSCLSCHQFYQNKLRIDIATEFVFFVRQQYPRDTSKQVEALYVKLSALIDMIEMLLPVQKREAGVTANVLLSLIERMKGDVSALPRRYSQMEAETFTAHGRIALDEGTEESARRAVTHFENQLEVNEAIGCARGIALCAKSTYESGNNNEELLKSSQRIVQIACCSKW
jgi:hypothetical protein